MDKHNFFFGEILDEFDLDNAIARAEAEIRKRAIDARTAGIASGCNLYAFAGDNNAFSVTPGVIVGPSGERIQLRDAGADTLGGYVTIDSDGNSTSPGAGNYRWITIAARFGRTMATPQTDDLANTIYTDLTDSWNAAGIDQLTDATQAANQLRDGGYQIDNFGLSLTSFYTIAGPAVTIGNSLTYASLPADAIILADVLLTDGDEGSPLNKLNISYIRQQISYPISTNSIGFPADTDLNFPKRLLWEIEAQAVKTRFYAGIAGLEITVNAGWNGETSRYVADDTNKSAIRLRFDYSALVLEQKFASDVGTPWTNVSQNTGGWDSFFRFQATSRSEVGYSQLNGNVLGNGVQLGYVALGMGRSGGTENIVSAFTSIQFPRAFNGVPSSVTLGSAISEINIASVAITNISQYGASFRLVPTSATISYLSQREYTATQ